MKNYSVIAFDLDGTLSNPERGLVETFSYALGKMGIDFGEKQELKRFIGPPLYDEWQRVYGLTPQESSRALEFFHEYYSVYGWWDNELYDGVEKMLDDLKRANKTIVLATSKPEIFAKKILKLFGIDGYFDFIGGASTDKIRDKKWEVLEYSLESIGSPSCDECILVGDRVYDAEGAARCGIASLGVLYGHGSKSEIESSGFTEIAENVADIAKLLI